MIINGAGHYQWFSTTKSELTDEIFIVLRSQNANARGAIKIRDIMIIEYQEGLEKWDIPYFEGMQSVEIPVLTTSGKNSFDGFIEKGVYGATSLDKINDSSGMRYRINEPFTVEKIQYAISIADDYQIFVRYFKNRVLIKDGSWVNQVTFDNTNGNYDKITIVIRKMDNSIIDENILFKLQIEEGSTVTSYEPYQSNILSTPQDLVLGGIGDVQDTLDLLTGEVELATVERGLSTLSNLNWSIYGSGTPNAYYTCVINDAKDGSKIISDSLVSTQIYTTNTEYGVYFSGNSIRLRNDEATSGMSVVDFKNSLSSSTNKIRYVLAEKVVKTVDLTCVNEQGESVDFMPIEGTMVANTSSQTLPPLLDMWVPVEATTQNLNSFANMRKEE